jgi:4'-phosphopantetheinyl transferase EntD
MNNYLNKITTLFPSTVIIVEAQDWDGRIYPEEYKFIKAARIKRQRDFIAGRIATRNALRRLNIYNFPILVGKHRNPLFPKNIIGSISHTKDYCAVVISNNKNILSLGFDAETRDSKINDNMMDLICTKNEKIWLKQSNNYKLYVKIIFSAKESIYKCYFPIIKEFLDFQDVEISINLVKNNFTFKILKTNLSFFSPHNTVNNFVISDKYIFTGVTIIKTI